jgi:hypothetical protein
MVTLRGKELVGLYLFLKHRDSELDNTLSTVFSKIERELFSRLSIEEFEAMDSLYKKGIDIVPEE